MKIDSNNTSRRGLFSANTLKNSTLSMWGGGINPRLKSCKSNYLIAVLLAGFFLFGASGCSKVSGSGEFPETESVDGIHTKTGPSTLPATDGTTPFGITLDTVWLPDTTITFNP